jgi:hypothetical protein
MPTDLDIEKYKNKILREWVDNLTKEVLFLEQTIDSKDTIINNLTNKLAMEKAKNGSY